MTDYLQLCKDVARESGTFPNLDTPATITGQTGRAQRVIYWVRDAYLMIQRDNSGWRWLNADFAGQTIAGVQSYDAAAMGIPTRFSRWRNATETAEQLFSIYKTSEGQADEGYLGFIGFDTFRRDLMAAGAATRTGKPCWITVNDQDELVLHPTPDDVYTLRGRYRRGPQVLTNGTDVPEMPEEFHDAIKWRALMLMGQFDEATNQIPDWGLQYEIAMDRLRSHQLPTWRLGGALA